MIRGHPAGYREGTSDAMPVPDMEALASEVTDLLESAPVAEALAAKLSRLLHAFLEADVLPQADR
jgi:hypothetical protein